jgi:hypothetical protein
MIRNATIIFSDSKGCRLRSHQSVPCLRSSLPRPPHPGVPVCRIPLPLPHRYRVDREPGARSRIPSFRGPSRSGLSAPVFRSRTGTAARVLLFLEDELKSRVELSRGLGQTAPQYTLFSGTAPRTPPRGSSTSPAYRGMRWTWRCITVWPAAFRTFTPML